MNWIYEPWPWYIGGLFIASTLILLQLLGKSFGFSSNLRTMCSMLGAGKTSDFFKIDYKAQQWNMLFLAGTLIGGYFAFHFLSDNNAAIPLAEDTLEKLHTLGFYSANSAYLPTELFANDAFYSIKNIALLALGGFFVGFGSRYAGGCTSGHAITGLSQFNLPSLIAVIGFFIGGLIMIHLIFPIIF